MPPPTLWRNAHTIPVHCLIHGSACPGCWECTGQVVGKVCTIPGTAPATWHPASPPCSRPSDPAATASDESGPRSAPNPSQPVENFHLQRLSALISQFCWQVGSAIKISWRDYSQLLSCLWGLRKRLEEVNGVWPGSGLLSIPHTGRLAKKKIQLQTLKKSLFCCLVYSSRFTSFYALVVKQTKKINSKLSEIKTS